MLVGQMHLEIGAVLGSIVALGAREISQQAMRFFVAHQIRGIRGAVVTQIAAILFVLTMDTGNVLGEIRLLAGAVVALFAFEWLHVGVRQPVPVEVIGGGGRKRTFMAFENLR